MSFADTNYIHGTAVSISGNGVVICGNSGSGKSDLAFRLLDRGAILVCDDIVGIEMQGSDPYLVQAPNIKGQIEVRGLGILTTECVNNIPLRLCVAVDESAVRLPEGWPRKAICGFDVPVLAVNAFEVSAAIKIEWALKALVDGNILPVAMSANSDTSI